MLAHTIGDALFDMIHHGIIFGVGIGIGVSYAAYKVFSRGK